MEDISRTEFFETPMFIRSRIVIIIEWMELGEEEIDDEIDDEITDTRRFTTARSAVGFDSTELEIELRKRGRRWASITASGSIFRVAEAQSDSVRRDFTTSRSS